MFKTLIASAAILAPAFAEMKPGACPVRNQSKSTETFDKLNMAGLWFEYVWDEAFSADYGYQCATWIILNDEEFSGPGQYTVYNNMAWENQEENEYIKFRLAWDQETEAG